MIINTGYSVKRSLVSDSDDNSWIDIQRLKSSLNIDYPDHDERLYELAVLARENVEEYTQRAIILHNVIVNFKTIGDSIVLPFCPIVGEVTIVDLDENEITDFTIVGEDIKTLFCESDKAIKITYQGGYENEEIPKRLKEAVYANVWELFYREPTNWRSIANPFKIWM